MISCLSEKNFRAGRRGKKKPTLCLLICPERRIAAWITEKIAKKKELGLAAISSCVNFVLSFKAILTQGLVRCNHFWKIKQQHMAKQKQYIFNGPKMFTASRKILAEFDLPASATASYILAHFLCDADSGEFTRDDSDMERMSGIPRQTIYEGFKPLLQNGLIMQTGSVYRIADYESLRKQKDSYFRIPKQFIQVIAKCVRHRLPNVITFGLQLLDQLRNEGASPTYSIHSLKRYLGLIPCRIRRKLALLSDVIRFEERQGITGDVFYFTPIVETLASEEQVKDRSVRGAITKHLKSGLDIGKKAHGAAADISNRFVRGVVSFLAKYHDSLESPVLTELTRVVGIKIVEKQVAGDRIRYPAAYLKASINDLLAQIQPGTRLALSF